MVNYFKKNRQMKEKRKIEPPDIPSPNKKEKENQEFILKGRMNGRMNRYHLFPTNRQNV